MFHQPIPAAIGVVSKEGERNPQPWTDAHKKKKCVVMAERMDKGSSMQLRTIAIRKLLSR